MTSITQTPAWLALRGHRERLADVSLQELFAQDPRRTETFRIELPGLRVDFSRHLATAETLGRLVALADQAGLELWKAALFGGERINNTERRAALHTLLRTADRDVPPSLREQASEVAATLDRMHRFSDAVRGGALRGATGERFTDVINIGIGGSHLGPELVLTALAPLGGGDLRVHFVSNVDPMHTARVVASLDPARTLVIVASKTFTTQETLANAGVVRAWLTGALGADAVPLHFAAVSAATGRAREFGIPDDRVFAFWDWVGGRYSLWSAVGLPVAIGLGFESFRALLDGAAEMDRHFREAPAERNLPVVLALIGVWYADFWQAQTRAVIPYRDDLRLLVPYLQQLEMESNGKRVRRDGTPVDYATAPVVWGDVGTNGQHAFFQLLHQGTHLVPVDFIAVLADATGHRVQQDMLLSNCLAQWEALMRGRTEAEARAGLKPAEHELAPHKAFPGNRPSTLLMLERLDARTLGQLIALYEHRTFVQACIWDLNPFDQMGVELGKQLADTLLAALREGHTDRIADPATRAALEQAARLQK